MNRGRAASLPNPRQNKTKRQLTVSKVSDASVTKQPSGLTATSPNSPTTPRPLTPVSPVKLNTAGLLGPRPTAPTNPLRPRSQSAVARNLQAAQAQSVGAAAPRPPLAQNPTAQQPLLVGTVASDEMIRANLQIADLLSKPGLQALLSTMGTTNRGPDVADFVKQLDSTAQRLPEVALKFLFRRRADLTGRPGLQDFLVARLDAADLETKLAKFLDSLRPTQALSLSANRLEHLYRRRDDVLGHVGLRDFLIMAHADGEAIPDLDAFVDDTSDGPAAKLDAESLKFLYSRRQSLRDQQGVKAFVIDALGAGESSRDLAAFLTDNADARITGFSQQQAAYLYKCSASVHGRAGLKELLIRKLATSADWEQALDAFLPAIAGSQAQAFNTDQLELLWAIQGDFAKPTGLPNITVKEHAIKVVSTPPLAEASTKLQELKTFEYQVPLLERARQLAKPRGAELLKAEAQRLVAAENVAWVNAQAELLAEAPPKNAGPKPVAILSGNTKKKNALDRAEWDAVELAHKTYLTNELPAKQTARRASIKQQFDVQRASLQPADYERTAFDEYKAFCAAAHFHADADWALGSAKGDVAKAQILFDQCHDDPALKIFGTWAATDYAGEPLVKVLDVARALRLDPARTRVVAPYLLKCSDQATSQWLSQRATNATFESLTFEIEILRAHSNKTLPIARTVIEAAPDQALLSQYNKLLATAQLGPCLQPLIVSGAIAAPAVEQLIAAYAGDPTRLSTFLSACEPLPQGYNSLTEICLLVKPNAHAPKGVAIDDVTFALVEGAARTAGKPYIEHVLKRLAENVSKAHITAHGIGHLEWLLCSGAPWANVTVMNQGYGANQMTGIFTMTINGFEIQVHNHFLKKGGEQTSLHVKLGKGSFSRGPELTTADKSVYATISQRCLTQYAQWVGNKGWDLYTIPT